MASIIRLKRAAVRHPVCVDATEVRKALTAALDSTAATRAARSRWVIASEDIVWVFELDRGASWSPLAILVGASVLDWTPGSEVPAAANCDVYIDYALLGESIPNEAANARFGDHKSFVAMMLDHTHALVTDEQRVRAFAFMASDLAGFANAHLSAAKLRGAIASGAFVAGFVSKQLRT